MTKQNDPGRGQLRPVAEPVDLDDQPADDPNGDGRRRYQGLQREDGTRQPDTPWLTPVQAAQYLRVALGTLRNWTSAKYVPFVRRGRVVRYHREQLDRWLRKGECRGRMTWTNTPATGAKPDFERN